MRLIPQKQTQKQSKSILPNIMQGFSEIACITFEMKNICFILANNNLFEAEKMYNELNYNELLNYLLIYQNQNN